MRLNDSDRLQLLVSVTVDRDPASGVLVLAVDGTDHACTWDGAATATAGKWTRQAHTSDYFAGPAVPTDQIAGAVVLAYGIHRTELRLTIGGTIVAQQADSIGVRAD